MTQRLNICVGAVGQGIWHSADGGERWMRVANGISFETEVRAFAVHPQRPEVIFAGTDRGLYRTENGGSTWKWTETALDPYHIWALAINPNDPNIMFAGTRPSAFFRSEDGGQTWEKLSVELAEECPAVTIPRVTGIAIDPVDTNTIWAGVEVDGLHRSRDGGDTWERIQSGLTNPDVHNVTVTPAPGGGSRVWAVVDNDVASSTDSGETWAVVGTSKVFPMNYCRGILVQPGNPDTVFMGVGDYTPGSTGVIERSKDAGKSWETLTLPTAPNTAMWCFGAHAADPKRIYASSLYGYLYESLDGGDSWRKVPREFSEVRALTWAPV
jgi:photosystem II stability/assembly factor-like uncharacterized protein